MLLKSLLIFSICYHFRLSTRELLQLKNQLSFTLALNPPSHLPSPGPPLHVMFSPPLLLPSLSLRSPPHHTMRFAKATAAQQAFSWRVAASSNALHRYYLPDVHPFLAIANRKPAQLVLDFGYGSGCCAIAVKQKVGATGEVVALDISSDTIAQARANVPKAGLPAESLRSILGDIMSLPAIPSLVSGHCDTIISL